MIARIELNGKEYQIDLNRGFDISLPMTPDPKAANAWYVPPVKIEPVRTEQFIGDVNEGGSVNFNNIFFNPHGNGTHTECVGHISSEHDSINLNLKRFFFISRLISVTPESIGEDLVITRSSLENILHEQCEAVVIRTNPNSDEKKRKQYSNTNPPYLHRDAARFLLEMGVEHILIDLPSVDREMDDGVLAAHHLFWNYPENPQRHRTITEFIFVPDEIEDAEYVLNLQVAAFENDAAPSRPILFKPVEVR